MRPVWHIVQGRRCGGRSGSVRPVAGAAGPKLGGSRAEPVAGRVSGRHWPQFLQESAVGRRAGQHSVIGPETRLVETVSAGLDQARLLSGYASQLSSRPLGWEQDTFRLTDGGSHAGHQHEVTHLPPGRL